MNRGLYTIASGGVAALARLDAAAQNLANVNTAGYKAVRPLFELRALTGGPRGAVDPVLQRTSAQVTQSATAYDFSPGVVRATGNPLDVAAAGDDWFVVGTPAGERYTRQGSFSVDAQGFLVTAQGHRVQGDRGDLQLGPGEVTMSGNGTLTVDGEEKGRLRLARFGPEPALVPEGATLYRLEGAGAAPETVEAAQARVVPGALESANVDAVKGLVELVDVSRAFEAYMGALRNLDELTKKSISDVGRF